MNKEKTITFRCDCGCTMLVIDKFDSGNYNISMQNSYFYKNAGIWHRIKSAVKMLLGKPIYYNDMWIEDKEKIVKLANELEELIGE